MPHHHLVATAAVVGLVGDATLQVLVANGFGGSSGWGLKSYFEQHGRAEAMCVAAGMMAIFFVIYLVLKLPLTIPALALYGVLLDLIFRVTRLFPSLDGYYAHLNYFESAIWGAIPMILPLLVAKKLFPNE
jgi:preprotein translocase subunit SecG